MVRRALADRALSIFCAQILAEYYYNYYYDDYEELKAWADFLETFGKGTCEPEEDRCVYKEEVEVVPPAELNATVTCCGTH